MKIAGYIQKKFYFWNMKFIFKNLARMNSLMLPSFTKQRLDLNKATKLQLAIVGWRTFITLRALD
nr:SsrA-binding protein [uncultured bacterium]